MTTPDQPYTYLSANITRGNVRPNGKTERVPPTARWNGQAFVLARALTAWSYTPTDATIKAWAAAGLCPDVNQMAGAFEEQAIAAGRQVRP